MEVFCFPHKMFGREGGQKAAAYEDLLFPSQNVKLQVMEIFCFFSTMLTERGRDNPTKYNVKKKGSCLALFWIKGQKSVSGLTSAERLRETERLM